MEGFFDDLVDRFKKNDRVEEMKQIARENGFRFSSRELFAKQNYLIKSFSIFSGKNDKRLKGIIMTGDVETKSDIRIYDYLYFGEIKKRKTTIFEIFCSELELPKFEIQPKSILKQVGSIFFKNKKPYPNESSVHSKFDINTDDVKDFEHEISLSVLKKLCENKNISIEGDGDFLLIYFTYQTIPASKIIDEYHRVLDLLDIILKDNSNEFV